MHKPSVHTFVHSQIIRSQIKQGANMSCILGLLPIWFLKNGLVPKDKVSDHSSSKILGMLIYQINGTSTDSSMGYLWLGLFDLLEHPSIYGDLVRFRTDGGTFGPISWPSCKAISWTWSNEIARQHEDRVIHRSWRVLKIYDARRQMALFHTFLRFEMK